MFLILFLYIYPLFALSYNRILRKRNDLGDYLQLYGTNFKTGVEIGVQEGIFSQTLLSSWKNCKKFYLVDVWKHLDHYGDLANVNSDEQLKKLEATKTRLSIYKSKTVFIQEYSAIAAKKFKSQGITFDFVYIDARHDYCSVKEDLNLYYELLNSGGIISGHDYFYKARSYLICPNGTYVEGMVKRAVDEFTIEKNITLNIIGDSWILHKP